MRVNERFQFVSTFFVFFPDCKIIRRFSTFTIKTTLPPGKFYNFISNPRLFFMTSRFFTRNDLMDAPKVQIFKGTQASLMFLSWRSSYQLTEWSSLQRSVRSSLEYWRNVPGGSVCLGLERFNLKIMPAWSLPDIPWWGLTSPVEVILFVYKWSIKVPSNALCHQIWWEEPLTRA